jgi:DNA-binding transcriptional MerR regulator
LGVAPATLRSWSLRYGIGPLDHTPGRHRRYTDADVAELEAVRGLVEQGIVLPTAAAIVRSRRLGGIAGGTATATATADDLVLAANRLDLVGMNSIIATSLAERGVAATWERLCRPALAGLDTALGGGPVDAPLLLSWAVATCLRRLPLAPTTPDGRGVLLACAAGEQHTLAVEALFAALVERRVPVRMLGASVPVSALVHAAEQLRPVAVVVWSQRAVTAKLAVLRRVTTYVDTVVAAGPGWHDVVLPPAVIAANSLGRALALSSAATSPPPLDQDRVPQQSADVHAFTGSG